MSEATFEDLRLRYRTGRAYTISGTGRNRVTGYRHGVLCRLGDIEASEWCQMVRSLIKGKGETKLFDDLLDYLKGHNYAKQTKTGLEEKALELHAARIFDDPHWVCFVEFNLKYRPQALEGVELIWIKSSCCEGPGQTTQALAGRYPEAIPCPHCGRWASYEIVNV